MQKLKCLHENEFQTVSKYQTMNVRNRGQMTATETVNGLKHDIHFAIFLKTTTAIEQIPTATMPTHCKV